MNFAILKSIRVLVLLYTTSVCQHLYSTLWEGGGGGGGLEKEYSLYTCKKAENCGLSLTLLHSKNNP